jgi:hypothetical protein
MLADNHIVVDNAYVLSVPEKGSTEIPRLVTGKSFDRIVNVNGKRVVMRKRLQRIVYQDYPAGIDGIALKGIQQPYDYLGVNERYDYF